MSAAIDFLTAGVRWHLLPALAPLRADLFDADGLRLGDWLADGRARVVKQGPHQAVCRVTLPGLDFYLKQYRVPDARAWLRGLLRPSKARLEFERARAVAGRGVPTVEPLALGEGRGVSYLLTRTLGGTVALHDFLELTLPAMPPRPAARLRQRLASVLGRFLARLHDAGVTHHDLHPGNLLLQFDGDGEPRLYLIDLYGTRVGPPLTWRQRRANLVVLNRWFSLRATPSDRLRCWLAYQQARAGPAAPRPAPDDRPADLEDRTLASNLRFWRQQDRRCLENNRYFRPIRRGAITGHAITDLDGAALEALLRDPDAPFERPGAVVLKRSPSATVIALDLPVAGRPCRVICKRFAVTSWADPWTALVRPTAALRSYMMGHGLRMRGLPTPRPLAVWHRRRLGLAYEGYLLTEQVPDAVDLLAHVNALAARPAARDALHRLIEQVARLVAALHRRRLAHRDLKAANLLVSPQPWSLAHAIRARVAAPDGAGAPPGAEGPQVWFIDLVGVSRHARLSWRRRVRNLARLHASFRDHPAVSRTDKLRFLCAYLGWRWLGGRGWKEWWRRIERATQAKVRRNLRQGRPLV
jgi:tRNA A-37 threonylcarbamoyl transferase component Bud32